MLIIISDNEKNRNSVDFTVIICYNIYRWLKSNRLNRLGVAQLVARYLGVVEAVGSSPVTQTI